MAVVKHVDVEVLEYLWLNQLWAVLLELSKQAGIHDKGWPIPFVASMHIKSTRLKQAKCIVGQSRVARNVYLPVKMLDDTLTCFGNIELVRCDPFKPITV